MKGKVNQQMDTLTFPGRLRKHSQNKQKRERSLQLSSACSRRFGNKTEKKSKRFSVKKKKKIILRRLTQLRCKLRSAPELLRSVTAREVNLPPAMLSGATRSVPSAEPHSGCSTRPEERGAGGPQGETGYPKNSVSGSDARFSTSRLQTTSSASLVRAL